MKNKKSLLVTGVGVVAVIVAVIIGMIVYSNSAPVKLRKQLELGQKYLAEQNYEQAVVAFQVAIEIDPMASDAYLGLADAYIGQGELEKAAEVLQTGYDLTADERLKDKLDKVNAEIERIKAEEEKLSQEIEKEQSSIQEIGQSVEDVVEELEMIDISFELSDFSIFGYDLFEDHFEDICMLLGVPSNSEFDSCDVAYGAFDGKVFVKCEENEKNISFNDIYGPSTSNQTVYEVYKDAHIQLVDFIYSTNYNETGNYVPAEFLGGPVLVGDSYQKWLDVVNLTEIEKVENREESEIETVYYFQTKWGRAKYSSGKDKELLGDQLEIFFSDDDNESSFSIWICSDSDNMIKQVYVTYDFDV